jgi:hypothetical protein
MTLISRNKARFSSLNEQMSEAELEQSIFEMDSQSIHTTLDIARVRCMPFSVMLRNLRNIHVFPNAGILVYHLSSMVFSHDEEEQLVPVLRAMAASAEAMPSSDKARMERYLKRLLRQLSAEAAVRVAGDFIEHPRKSRRQLAFDVFARTGITPELTERLVSRYHANKEQECLELLARFPIALSSLTPSFLLRELESEYWRARVIQNLLAQGAHEFQRIPEEYPHEFVHAVGRARSRIHLKTMLKVFPDNSRNLDFLGIFAWALGELRCAKHLTLVEEALSEIEMELQATFKQGETDMGDTGKKDKGKREVQKKAKPKTV